MQRMIDQFITHETRIESLTHEQVIEINSKTIPFHKFRRATSNPNT